MKYLFLAELEIKWIILMEALIYTDIIKKLVWFLNKK